MGRSERTVRRGQVMAKKNKRYLHALGEIDGKDVRVSAISAEHPDTGETVVGVTAVRVTRDSRRPELWRSAGIEHAIKVYQGHDLTLAQGFKRAKEALRKIGFKGRLEEVRLNPSEYSEDPPKARRHFNAWAEGELTEAAAFAELGVCCKGGLKREAYTQASEHLDIVLKAARTRRFKLTEHSQWLVEHVRDVVEELKPQAEASTDLLESALREVQGNPPKTFKTGTLVKKTSKFLRSIGSVTGGPIDGLVLGSSGPRLLVAWSDGHTYQIQAANVQKARSQMDPASSKATVTDERKRARQKMDRGTWTVDEIDEIVASYRRDDNATKNPSELEGPFRFPSGRVVFYDPGEGKYYDRAADLYLSESEVESMQGASKRSAKSRRKGAQPNRARIVIPRKKVSQSWQQYHDQLVDLAIEARETMDEVTANALLRRAGHIAEVRKKVRTAPRGKGAKGPGSYPWDQCMTDATKRYGSPERARRVCGSIRAKSKRDYPAYWKARDPGRKLPTPNPATKNPATTKAWLKVRADNALKGARNSLKLGNRAWGESKLDDALVHWEAAAAEVADIEAEYQGANQKVPAGIARSIRAVKDGINEGGGAKANPSDRTDAEEQIGALRYPNNTIASNLMATKGKSGRAPYQVSVYAVSHGDGSYSSAWTVRRVHPDPKKTRSDWKYGPEKGHVVIDGGGKSYDQVQKRARAAVKKAGFVEVDDTTGRWPDVVEVKFPRRDVVLKYLYEDYRDKEAHPRDWDRPDAGTLFVRLATYAEVEEGDPIIGELVRKKYAYREGDRLAPTAKGLTAGKRVSTRWRKFWDREHEKMEARYAKAESNPRWDQISKRWHGTDPNLDTRMRKDFEELMAGIGDIDPSDRAHYRAWAVKEIEVRYGMGQEPNPRPRKPMAPSPLTNAEFDGVLEVVLDRHLAMIDDDKDYDEHDEGSWRWDSASEIVEADLKDGTLKSWLKENEVKPQSLAKRSKQSVAEAIGPDTYNEYLRLYDGLHRRGGY